MLIPLSLVDFKKESNFLFATRRTPNFSWVMYPKHDPNLKEPCTGKRHSL